MTDGHIPFRSRSDAGMQLAKRLLHYQKMNPLILAIPRGGVVVGSEIAKALSCALDVVIVRKISSPHNPELAVGAIAEGEVQIVDEQMIGLSYVTKEEIKKSIEREKNELLRRVKLYRGSPFAIRPNQTVILVDDGLATGYTMQAAIMATRKQHPEKIVCAVPLCAYDTLSTISPFVDDMIALYYPSHMRAVGQYYTEFNQVTDEEVVRLLHQLR